MWEPYSKRNVQPIDTFRYDFSQNVRGRILATLRDMSADLPGNGEVGFPVFLDRMAPWLERAYGTMAKGAGTPIHVDFLMTRSQRSALGHIFACSDEQVVDFMEVGLLIVSPLVGTAGAEEMNQILKQERIGYELTLPEVMLGRPYWGVAEHSVALKKSDELMHANVIMPALGLLADPRFAVANKEMLAAHDHFRHDRLDDAITACGASFESVLKTICSVRGWKFDADKDTLSKLISICRDKGLFPAFYAPFFEATGTVRNKLGDAHGRGPTPLYVVEKAHVDHVIQMVSANILLLIGLAKA